MPRADTATKTIKDPVCGMQVDPLTTTHHADHDGKDYHFCSGKCEAKFVANPQAFVGEAISSHQTAPDNALWTCPMHPQIQQKGPGACPICGMALEPMAGNAGNAPILLWFIGAKGALRAADAAPIVNRVWGAIT